MNPAQTSDTLIETLRSLEPISGLTPDLLDELSSHITVESIKSGEFLYAKGELVQQAIYLIDGQIELCITNEPQAQSIVGGSEAARHPITENKDQLDRIIAISDLQIVRIDQELLDTLLTWAQISAPDTEVIMNEDGIMMIDKGNWLRIMFQSPTFRKLPPANIEALLDRLEPIKVSGGDVIIKQGDIGDYFYMIDQGNAMVTRNPDDDESSIEMAEINAGRSFGEAALISDKPRNATISMMSDGILLRLSKEDFVELLKTPSIQWLNYESACQTIEQGAQWIDVRMPKEFERNHLPGAINIPMRELHRQAHDLDKNKAYICYCQTGRRSSAAAFTLNQYGFKATVIKNGLNDVPTEALTQ